MIAKKMQKTILNIILIMLCGIITAKAQSDEEPSAVISLPSFHTIDIRGNVHLLVVPSDTTSAISIDFMELNPKHFKYKVKRGVLYVDVNSGLLLKNHYLRIVATTPELNEIKSNGANVEFLGTMVTQNFTYSSNGGVNTAQLMLDTDNLDIRVMGASDVSVEGVSVSANMLAMAGSRINALALGLDSLVARASDGSEIYALPRATNIATARTWGTIYYGLSGSIQPRVTTGGDVVLIQRVGKAQRFAEYVGISADEVLEEITESAPTKMPDRGVETNTNNRKKAKEEEVEEDFF